MHLLYIPYSPQAIGHDNWDNDRPLQVEEDLWDDSLLEVSMQLPTYHRHSFILFRMHVLPTSMNSMYRCMVTLIVEVIFSSILVGI